MVRSGRQPQQSIGAAAMDKSVSDWSVFRVCVLCERMPPMPTIHPPCSSIRGAAANDERGEETHGESECPFLFLLCSEKSLRAKNGNTHQRRGSYGQEIFAA